MKTDHMSLLTEIVLDVVQTEPSPTVDNVAICGWVAQHKDKTRHGIPTMWVSELIESKRSCAAYLQCSDNR